jgi:hypothetical protein
VADATVFWARLEYTRRAGLDTPPLLDHDTELTMSLVTPAPTAESHLRNVLQAVQGVLDLAEGPAAVRLPRRDLERWQALLVLAIEALAAPAS